MPISSCPLCRMNNIFFTIEDEESSMILLQYSGRRDRNVDKSNMDEQNKTYWFLLDNFGAISAKYNAEQRNLQCHLVAGNVNK